MGPIALYATDKAEVKRVSGCSVLLSSCFIRGVRGSFCAVHKRPCQGDNVEATRVGVIDEFVNRICSV